MTGLPDWAQATPERRAHIERVASLLGQWADSMKTPPVEKDRWLRAAYLHDAVKDAPLSFLAPHAPRGWDHEELFHGPAAAAIAAGHGETDRGVLDAARYHSVGYAGWDAAGRMLYLADYLEPGRPEERAARAAQAALVPRDPARALLDVAEARLEWVVGARWPLLPETVEFWNALTQDG